MWTVNFFYERNGYFYFVLFDIVFRALFEQKKKHRQNAGYVQQALEEEKIKEKRDVCKN